MTNIWLSGEPPFRLPVAQAAEVATTTDAIEITFKMVASDGKLQPVTVSLVARKAVKLAEEVGEAAGHLLVAKRNV